MKTKTIPALEPRTQLGQIMKDVQGGRVRVLVEKSGVPMVGIISAEEFQRLIAERETRFAVVDRIRRRLPSVSEARIQRDVREALPVEPVPGVCRDPDDDYLLGCAAAGGVEYLVTGDDDLLSVGQSREVAIVDARHFLAVLAA